MLTSLHTHLSPTKIMPATKECPLCGGTMQLRENQTVVHIPGNPNATTRTTREWVCPDCDYFEEAEEEGT
jgi:ssDNA-binding Zn-finger/Zn-ribbon topoisomerase 1